jgi:hypothetical protein
MAPSTLEYIKGIIFPLPFMGASVFCKFALPHGSSL